MIVSRGEIWWANLDPVVGSEQAGRRPVLVLQSDAINSFTSTVVAVPLTTNLRRAELPSCVFIPQSAGNLSRDSVALCHQLRVLDQRRLVERVGKLESKLLLAVEAAVLFTLGITFRPAIEP